MHRICLLFPMLLLGCNPTYAPPVHTNHGGSPARLADADAQLGLSGNVPGAVSPALELPLAERFSVELGGDFADSWAMGTAGLRLTGLPQDIGGDVRFVPDLVLGFGVGRGGERCGNLADDGDGNCDGDVSTADGLAWHQRVAGGGYAGGGVGLHIYGGFAVFARGLMRVSSATGVPTTFWLSAVGGIDQQIGPVSLYLSAGWFAYTNDLDANDGPVLEAGLSLRFGADD